jgi:hypothetical protein
MANAEGAEWLKRIDLEIIKVLESGCWEDLSSVESEFVEERLGREWESE